MIWHTFFQPFIEFGFMRRALVVCLALSLSTTMLGVFLLLRRMSLMGDALSHAILPGVAVGYLLSGMSLLAMTLGGFIAGIVVALVAGNTQVGPGNGGGERESAYQVERPSEGTAAGHAGGLFRTGV